MIDGGKGQLAAALESMAAYDLPRTAVISLAKRIEEVFLPGRPQPVLLPATSPGLQLLQRWPRDEAAPLRDHVPLAPGAMPRRAEVDVRSSSTASRPRTLAGRCSVTSAPAERVVEASAEELEGVPGVPSKTARDIYAQLHRAGRA